MVRKNLKRHRILFIRDREIQERDNIRRLKNCVTRATSANLMTINDES